jgi:hypothetical protein
MYGTLRPGISYITLEQPDGTQVQGTVAYDPGDDRFLLFTVNPDSVPANTLPPVDAVINPLLSGPGAGLPAAQANTRYLLTEATGTYEGTVPTAWQGLQGQPLVANANDVIAWNGSYWTVAFDSQNTPGVQYLTNLNTTVQYCWTGTQWVKSVDGLYNSAEWSLVL